MRLFLIALFCVAVSFAFSACQDQQIDTQRQNAPSSLARVLGPALADECPAGGVELEYGIDTNQDGTLDDLEVNGSYSICHGEAGQDGKPCISMPNDDGGFEIKCPDQEVLTIGGGPQGEAGAQGPQGLKGEAGPDGLPGEPGKDGAPGTNALVFTTVEPSGENCAQGGVRIDSGLDSDSNGQLDEAEMTQNSYVCNGSDGALGAKGDTGAQGLKGEAGTDGKDGVNVVSTQVNLAGELVVVLSNGTIFTSSSIIGPKGDTGPIGAKGDTGLIGATGATGAKGDTGSIGATGASGAKGDTGSIGATGATGAKGDTGSIGATGATGAKGDTGAAGAAFTFGDFTVNQLSSLKGAKGDTGAQGGTGVTGATGAQGDTGATGATGVTGDTGAIGPAGITPTGECGAGTAVNQIKADGTVVCGVVVGDTLWTDVGTYISADNAANVVVTDTGRVGIGTNNPAVALEVVGGARVSGVLEGAGGVQLGKPTTAPVGTLRWTGTELQVNTSVGWQIVTMILTEPAQCVEDGGDWELSQKICYFSGSSCPSGWKTNANYSTTEVKSCSHQWGSGGLCSATVGPHCTTGSHVRANVSTENCMYCNNSNYGDQASCSATMTERGCSQQK